MKSRPRSPSRSLRWPKFFVLLFFASICGTKALPVARVLFRLLEAPAVFHPEPLLLPALGLFATLVLSVGILLDAAFDRLLSRGALAALILLAALPWGARERSPEEERREIRLAAGRVAEAIAERRDQGVRIEGLGPGFYRTRSLRRLPLEVSNLPEERPLPPEEEVRPGRFYASLSGAGRFLIAGVLADGGPALLRRDGAIELFPIPAEKRKEPSDAF